MAQMMEARAAANGLGDPFGHQESDTVSDNDYEQSHTFERLNGEPTSNGSRPSTAKRSRPSTMHSHNSSSAFEEVSLDEDSTNDYDAGYSLKLPDVSPRKSSLVPSSHSRSSSLVHSRLAALQVVSPAPEPRSPDGSDYSGSQPQSPKSPSTPTVQVSPLTPHEAHMSIDSLHSIRLSQSSLDYDHLSKEQVDAALATPKVKNVRHLRKPSSLEILENSWRRPEPVRQNTLFDITKDEPLDTPVDGYVQQECFGSNDGEAGQPDESYSIPRRQSTAPPVTVMDASSIWRTDRGSNSSGEDEVELDWQALDKTEEQEKWDRDLPEGAEDESTAFLLARLEQENAKFSSDPKSAASVAINKSVARVRSQSRPPSIAHLKKLVSSQDTPSIRYSLAPDVQEQLPAEVPPMTELEFWAALVQDYPSTATRLPTLTTTKIRAGIPPPLRGVVWASMSGARDRNLEDAFETLQHEQSPYEGIINKDVGRSFPGVELFRDAEGEGQKMLGRVLKCFSLHDKDIGYCQGLGFLVGPLLMNMGEKEAFCVLVRLMDHYSLRPSFLPSLSGLHMRIFQFSNLLEQHHPELSEHLTNLGVEPAYLSQWFLSCFAVTCPLPMLFRIYDVIFAEGANETVMRVALALFRRNEAKMLESTEFEEVMQLLLGRAIWDVYACNADELVDDFTSLGNIITHARLAELEQEFESKDTESVGQSAGFLPDVQAAASRFLGRLWAPSHGHTPSKSAATALSPQSAEKEVQGTSYLTQPGSFLRRSPSKQNIPLINEITSSDSSNSSGSGSIVSTAPTETDVHDLGTESQADSASMKSKAESLRTVSMSTSAFAQLPTTPSMNQQQELHSQIEDLLMALSEMQREHAQMAAMLQKEREERNDDHRVVRQLLSKLTNGATDRKVERRSMPPTSRPSTANGEDTSAADKRRTLPARPRAQAKKSSEHIKVALVETNDDVVSLVEGVQSRLNTNARFSASLETKAQLRSTLARTREQLAIAQTQVKDLSERAEFSETSLNTFQGESESLRAEVEELRTRVNDDFKEKKKLELTIENMQIQQRMEAKAVAEKQQRMAFPARSESSGEVPTLKKTDTPSRSRTGSVSSINGHTGGLRELKLGRRDSSSSITSVRSMKSRRQVEQGPISPTVDSPPGGQANDIPSMPPTPKAELAPPLAQSSSLAVPAPSGPYFSRRTTSLATQEVLATQQHEPLPDEALLLELVNAKTAEATARQELDELRRSMQLQKKRAEEAALQMQAETASAKLELERALEDAQKAREDVQMAQAEARAAREEVFDASPIATSVSHITSVTTTPASDSRGGTPGPVSNSPSPVQKPETPPASSGGGWFWNRRTASTAKAGVSRSASEDR